MALWLQRKRTHTEEGVNLQRSHIQRAHTRSEWRCHYCSVIKCCTLVHHHVIVHHTEARGPIAVSLKHRQEEKKRRREKQNKKEKERTQRKVTGQNITCCISCDSPWILERRVQLFLCGMWGRQKRRHIKMMGGGQTKRERGTDNNQTSAVIFLSGLSLCFLALSASETSAVWADKQERMVTCSSCSGFLWEEDNQISSCFF